MEEVNLVDEVRDEQRSTSRMVTIRYTFRGVDHFLKMKLVGVQFKDACPLIKEEVAKTRGLQILPPYKINGETVKHTSSRYLRKGDVIEVS